MRRVFQRLWLLLFLFLNMGVGLAQESAPAPMPRAIPYKSDSASLEDQSTRTLVVLVGLLALTAGGLYYLRRRMPGLAGLATSGPRLKVVERVKLNPRCTMYLISLDQQEVLLVQCGDALTQVKLAECALASDSSAEDGRA